MNGHPQLTFADKGTAGDEGFTGDTITRATGSWITDGFTVGQTIAVTGTEFNNKTFEIADITNNGTTLVLSGSAELKAETPETKTTKVERSTKASNSRLVLGVNEKLNFSDNSASLTDTRDTITRTGTDAADSWIKQGFAVGDQITVSGAGTVGIGTSTNNGTYTIDEISNDGKKLTLVKTDTLVTQSGVDNTTDVDNTLSVNRSDVSSSTELRFGIGVAASVNVAVANNRALIEGNVIETAMLQSKEQVIMRGTPDLTIVHSDVDDDTITRTSGSWLADGFAVGDVFTIDGDDQNAGIYQITAISGDGLTLSTDSVLVPHAEMSATELTITNNGTTEVDEGFEGDSISRTTGSWTDDGFAAGDVIKLDGDVRNGDTYTIREISADGRTIYLDLKDELNSYDFPRSDITVVHYHDITIERRDVIILRGDDIVFTHNDGAADTITRTGGNWSDSDVTHDSGETLQSGDIIAVSGNDNYTAYYTVASVTGDTITLVADDAVIVRYEGSLTVNRYAPVVMSGSPELMLIHSDTDRDTITRSGGSWADDGFEAGYTIQIIGEANNAGTYTIDEISEDGLILYLDSGDVLIPTAPVANGIDLTLTDNTGENDERDTITRASGSWLDDGFQSGYSFTITGDAENTEVYTISDISADGLTLYLDLEDELAGDGSIISGLTVTGYGIPQAGLGVEHENWVEMETPLDLILTNNGTNRDLITRSDGLSWIDEGYSAGDKIELFEGSTSLGEFTIDEFSEDEYTIMLMTDDNIDITVEQVSGLTVERVSFTTITLVEDGANDKIARSDGSWIADGFKEGDEVTVSGTSHDGQYTIESLTDSEITLTDATTFGATESDLQNISIYKEDSTSEKGLTVQALMGEAKTEFDPSETITNSTITVGANHGFVTGDEVFYSKGITSNVAIGGLEEGSKNLLGIVTGKKYYVIAEEGSSTIRLAATEADATAGKSIVLDKSVATGTDHKITKVSGGTEVTFTPSTAVSVLPGITFENGHSYKNGDAVVYNTTGTAIGGLTAGNTYYVIINQGGLNTVGLAATAADAQAGKAIALDKNVATGTDHSLSDSSHSFGAIAVSGASGGSFGLSGSFAINVSVTNSEAYVAEGSTLNVGNAGNYGNVLLNAENRSSSLVSATAQGDARTAAASATGSTTSTTTTGTTTGETTSGPSSDRQKNTNVGMGGSVAVNVGVNSAKSEIAGGAELTGAGDLALKAKGDHALSTTAKAGAGGTIAITPSAAITVGVNTTEAILPDGEGLVIDGGLTLSAEHKGSTSSTAASDAVGKDAGVGLSLAVNVGVDLARAELDRDVTSTGTGNAVIEASTISDSLSSATGGARGSAAAAAGTTPQTADQKTNSTLGFGTGKAGTGGTKVPSNQKRAKAKGSGDGTSFSVGGALAVNVAVSDSTAIITSGTTLDMQGGSASLIAKNDTDSVVKADGSAAGTDVGVAGGIAVNTVIAGNKAIIDGDLNADGLTLKAVIADDGEPLKNSKGEVIKDADGNPVTAHQSSVTAISGAGGTNVGVAGAGAVNVEVIESRAVISSASRVDVSDGNDADTVDGAVEIEAENRTYSRVLATSKAIVAKASSTSGTSTTSNTASSSENDGTSVGVGGSFGLNVGVHTARAEISDSAVLVSPSSLSVKAIGDHDMETSVVAGSAG